MEDKLIELILYTPHVSDFIYQRENGTYYADRRNHGQSFIEVTKGDAGWIFGEIIQNG